MSYSSDFYAKFSKIAQEEEKRSGVPASVKLAQGMIESKSGDGSFLSTLAAKYNNYFGIKKGVGWTGKTVKLPTWEEIGGKRVKVMADFRVYDTPEDSWRDHTDFLLKNPRYAENGVFSSNDPRTVATALKQAGYATGSGYVDLIMKVINGSNLTKYDTGTKPIGDPSKAPAGNITSGGGNGGTVTVGDTPHSGSSGSFGDDSSNGSNPGAFGLGSFFGVNLDQAFSLVLFLLIGILLLGAGLFVTFGNGGLKV